jgi:hypothetical protein
VDVFVVLDDGVEAAAGVGVLVGVLEESVLVGVLVESDFVSDFSDFSDLPAPPGLPLFSAFRESVR